MVMALERGKFIFQKTERELVRLAAGREPESVHGFRTTARRLQTLVEQICPSKNRNQKKLVKMLGRIRKRAGKVRDLDVQLAALRSLKVPQEPRRKTQLTQSLLDLRAEHESKLRKLLKKSDVREIKKRLKRASNEGQWQTSSDPLAVARKMMASVALPAGPASEDQLHRYRIMVKQARYAAEFAPKSAESAQFINQLKRLQDALGHWHDWLTLTHTAVQRIGDVNQSSLVAALTNVTRGKFRQAVSAVSSSRFERRRLKRPTAIPPPSTSGKKNPTTSSRHDVAA
jgi:CHAD domain-containing protein